MRPPLSCIYPPTSSPFRTLTALPLYTYPNRCKSLGRELVNGPISIKHEALSWSSCPVLTRMLARRLRSHVGSLLQLLLLTAPVGLTTPAGASTAAASLRILPFSTKLKASLVRERQGPLQRSLLLLLLLPVTIAVVAICCSTMIRATGKVEKETEMLIKHIEDSTKKKKRMKRAMSSFCRPGNSIGGDGGGAAAGMAA